MSAASENALRKFSLPAASGSRRVPQLALGLLVLMTSSCLAMGAVGLAISTGWLASAMPGAISEGGPSISTSGASGSEDCLRARRCCEAVAGQRAAACAGITNQYRTVEHCVSLVRAYRQSLVVSGQDTAACDSASFASPPVGAGQAPAAERARSEACVRAQRCCNALMQHNDPSSENSCDVYALPYVQEHTCVESIAAFREGLRSASVQISGCE